VSKRVFAGLLPLVVAAAAFAAEPPVRDPTQPFGSTAAAGASARAAAPRFTLTVVLISPTRRVAIVNGKAHATGETVDGAEIVANEHDSVRLRERGAEVVISLGRPGNGRPSVQGEAVP
jgi:hypothetical protein